MKLAIHNRPGSFSDRWIAYCEKENIDYKIVDAFDTNIIEQMKNSDALLWHHHHGHFKDVLTAKRILFVLEHAGVKVFPDFKTDWHFDDKVAQKYLLEAIDAPLVPSYVFYDKQKALDWVTQTDFPKVFKLKGGSASLNVKLIKSKKAARKLIKRAFNKGFTQFNRWNYLQSRYRKYKAGNDNFLGVLKGFGRLIIPTKFSKQQSREKGYVYFQDFMPDNDFDIRMIVVSGKAYGMKRKVQEGDFKASGSGSFVYDDMDLNVVRIALETSRKLGVQSMAYDFIYDRNKNPLIVEMSYAFGTKGSSKCPGYWDQDLNWHKEKFNPQEWMIKDLIKELKNSN